MIGGADYALGARDFVTNFRFDLIVQLNTINYLYVSRLPQEVVSYGNITYPFKWLVWVAALVSFLLFATFFHLAHNVYVSKDVVQFKLVLFESSPFNFYLYTFSKLTEPDPIRWFPKWSAGRMAILFLSVISAFLVMFYNSNLRAHMMIIEYEKPLQTLEDIAENGKAVYIFAGAFKQQFVSHHRKDK